VEKWCNLALLDLANSNIHGMPNTFSNSIPDCPNIPTPISLQARPNPPAAARLRASIVPTSFYFRFTPTPFHFTPVCLYFDPFSPLLAFASL
jgi:hypothetical protein